MRTLVIGDIHGSLSALEALSEFVDFAPDDTIVTLGDYVDRGPDSKEVIDFLIELRESHEVVTLKGNHEVMMENARHSEQELYFWLMNGGEATLNSFHVANPNRLGKEVSQRYWHFIAACDRFYETSNQIIVHAGLDAETDLEDQDDRDLYWRRILNTEPHQSGKKLICGHTPQKNGDPLVLDHAVCIDTFAFGKDGWLTCLDIETGTYWQANSDGETRKNTL
ncbi:MAG: serine/threonine protein phosphatase [Verrucomicrobiae bacterium]|nr:serine/threonine protein phosphatase [Verrucomicrobiae bacterium]NNJ86894.1 serine/threonine protein phosphatase [Akkermansiaceae bacterium]